MSEFRKNAIWVAVIIVVVTVIVITRAGTDDNLTGVWKLESTKMNGGMRHRDRELWVFRQGTMSIVRDNSTYDMNISVDPSTSPCHLDADGVFQALGIYEIDGDTLRIAQVVRDIPRPTEFNTTWGDMRTVSVLSRVDGNTQISTADLNALLVSEFGLPTTYPNRIEFDKEADEFISDLMRDMTGDIAAKKEVIYHVSWLITEINNGGFHQFFSNSSGGNAAESATLLRKIGAPETATLVETGCKLFPNGTPAKDQQKRRAQLDNFTLDQIDTLRDLEERFYSRREDLNLLLKHYWERQS